jgi:hypothetical protein
MQMGNNCVSIVDTVGPIRHVLHATDIGNGALLMLPADACKGEGRTCAQQAGQILSTWLTHRFEGHTEGGVQVNLVVWLHACQHQAHESVEDSTCSNIAYIIEVMFSQRGHPTQLHIWQVSSAEAVNLAVASGAAPAVLH